MPSQSLWSRVPLAARWTISLLVGVIIVVALVLFVSHNNGNGLAHQTAKQSALEQRQDAKIMSQEQAPHVVRVTGTGSTAARSALVAAIRTSLRHQIAQGIYDGPLGSVTCVAHGGDQRRQAFHCLAFADHVRYPFLAVATPAAHQVVYCRREYAPRVGESFPVSSRCRL